MLRGPDQFPAPSALSSAPSRLRGRPPRPLPQASTRLRGIRSRLFPARPAILLALSLIAGCAEGTDGTTGDTGDFDASIYFPIEPGRYWTFFDPDDRFLTLEFTGTTTVVGTEALVLTWTLDYDTTAGDPVEPALEQYFANDPDGGVLLYGYKDYLNGESGTFVPGVVFAGKEMEVGGTVTTATAESGQLASFSSTLVAHGIAEAYYGRFPDAVDITFGRTDGAQNKHFLANAIGPVKLDWEGVRFQLYDYGTR